MKTPVIFLLALLVMNPALFAQDKDAFAVQVTIEHGIIEGNYNTHNGIQSYLGVPFAKPPVGDLRWKEPQPLEHWDGVKETKAFGPRPMQTIVFGDMKSRSRGISEDCLYLNIWTSALRNTKNLPVLVYFYGGGNVAGDASERRYDGTSMAKQGIVVVSANYRLNVFGFLAHPELSTEAPYKASGNYGLLDSMRHFNGYKKTWRPLGAIPASREVYEIYNESKRFRFPIVIDGYFLPKSLPEIFNSKELVQVPLLLGWNSAEIPGKAFMQGQPYTEESYINKVKEISPLYLHDKKLRFSQLVVTSGLNNFPKII